MRLGTCLATLFGLLLTLGAPASQAGVISWDGSAIEEGSTYFRPTGIALGSDGNLYVGDTDRAGTAGPLHERIVSFDPDGGYVDQFEIGYPPSGVAADSVGNLYVATDFFTDKVKKYTLAGAAGVPAGFSVANPGGVAIGAGAELFAADTSNLQVVRFNSSTGASPGQWATGSYPAGIATAPTGDVYVTQPDASQVSRYQADGTPVSSFSSPGAGGVAVDSTGNVYVTSDDGVRKYDSTGAFLGIWDIARPAWIAVDGSGRVYVTRPTGKTSQASGGDVVRLDPATEAPTAALAATPAAPLASQLVTFDASGSTAPAFGTITHYEWDLDGDGVYETDGGVTPTISRRFSAVGSDTVGVRVTGSIGPPSTKTITVDVAAPPTAIFPPASIVSTGDPVPFDAYGSRIDGSQIEHLEWDLDGDGAFETDTGTTLTVERSYDSPAMLTVAVRITRSGGRVDTATAALEVRRAPPPGELGISINHGDFATNDPHVTLSLVWPRLAASALVSNDGGFGDAGSTEAFPVAQELPWTLPSTRSERLAKTVYLRFREGA